MARIFVWKFANLQKGCYDIYMTLTQDIERVVAGFDFGVATAAKRGRNPKFPYVPIIKFSTGGIHGDGWTKQIKMVAYVTREEAVAAAQSCIDQNRVRMAQRLANPAHRAERAQYGLPWEIV
jgi:hypothetical protein